MVNKTVNKGNNSLPTQNNISSTIKSQIADLTDVVEVVVKAISKKGIIYNAKTVASAKLYSAVVKTLFNENGVIPILINAINTLSVPLKIDKSNYENIKSFKHIISYVNDLSIYLIGQLITLNEYNKELGKYANIFENIIVAVQNISVLNNVLSKTVPSPVNVKLIKRCIKNISNISQDIYNLSLELNAFNIETLNKKELYAALIESINNVSAICNELNKIEPAKTLNAKRRAIKRGFSTVLKIFNDINNIEINNDEITALSKKLEVIKSPYNIVISTFNGLLNYNLPKKKLNTKGVKSLINSIITFNNDLTEFVDKLIESNDKKIDVNKLNTGITDILNAITKIYDTILNTKDISVKLKLRCLIIKKDINRIIRLINNIENIKINEALISNIKNKLSIITGVYEEIAKLFTTISNIKTPKFIAIQLFFITRAIYKLVRFAHVLSILIMFIGTMTIAQIVLLKLNVIVDLVISLFNTVNNIKINVKTFIKIKLLPTFLFSLIRVLRTINIIAEIINRSSAIKYTAQIFAVFVFIKQIFAAISDIPVGIFIKIKLSRLRKNILTLGRIINAIDLLRIRPSVFIDLILLQLIIGNLSAIFTQIIIFSPIYLLGSIAIWALVGAVFILKIAIKVMTKILSKLAMDPMTILGFASLVLILGFITALSGMLLVIALVATPIVKNTLKILALFGIITLVAGISLGLGALMVLAAPILVPAIAGLALLTIVVVSIGVIALILKGIEMLDLDSEKIKANVDTVLSTAKMIINSIFGNDKDPENKESKKGFIASIIEFVGGTVATILKSVLAVQFLATTMVSIFIILLISMQLRLIQMLDLDQNKILQNVNIVISSALTVVDAIFNRGKDPDGEESNKSWISSILENFGGSLFTIVKAILSVAFLSTTLIAIQFILIISMQLRLIQALNLDPDKIKSNVDTVITTALNIVDAIFNRNETNNEGSNKSWLVSLIEFVGGPIIKIAQAIMAVQFLAMSIASILLVTVLAKQLKTIADINLPDDISGKVNSIIIAADKVSTALFNRKDENNNSTPDEKKKGFLSKVFSHLGGAIDMIASMGWLSTALVSVGMISKLAEHLTTINNLPDVTNIVSKTEAVCNSADMLIKHMTTRPDYGGEVESNSRIDIIDKINKSIQSIGNIEQNQIKKIDKVFDDYSKFIDKVNTVDVAKLENSTKMFAQMANFSNSIKGDFTKLAETLNENLMPVLQELKEIMGVIPEKLDTGFQNTSASIAATTVAPTQETVTAQVNRENPSMTKKEVDNIVQQRMKDYSKTEATGVVAKLDQLIDLLKGYSGENVMVKTV